MIPILYNLESPQTQIGGYFMTCQDYKFIVINLTCHNILFGNDENVLINSIVATINHECIHELMTDYNINDQQEKLIRIVDKYFYPTCNLSRGDLSQYPCQYNYNDMDEKFAQEIMMI